MCLRRARVLRQSRTPGHRSGLLPGRPGCESGGVDIACTFARPRPSSPGSPTACRASCLRRLMEQTRPVAASRLALRDEIREGPDLRLNAVDLSFQLRPEAFELSFRFETVHRRPSHFLLGSTDLRPIPGLHLSKSFELPFA